MMRRAAIGALLALVVLSGTLAPLFATAGVDSGPTGTAAAEHGDLVSCTTEIMLWSPIWADYSSGGPCDNDIHDETLSDWLGVYNQGAQQAANAKSYHDAYENALAGWEDQAWLEAERVVASELANGSSASEARVAAKEAVDRFYAVRQKNFVNQWNNQAAAIDSMQNQTAGISGITRLDVFHWSIAHGYVDNNRFRDGRPTGASTATIELMDGNTTMIRTLEITYQWNNNPDQPDWDTHSNQTHFQNQGIYDLFDNGADARHVNLRTPEDKNASQYPSVAAVWPEARFNSTWNDIQAQRDEVHSEIDLWTTEMDWDQVNETDLLSKVNLMNRYQLDAAGENRTFNDALIALSASGYSTTNLSSTGYMNVTYTGQDGVTQKTVDGMLASSEAPPGETWEIGTQYDSNTLSGSQMVADLNGSLEAINGTFTINEVYNRDGETVEDITIESPDRDFRATNTTEMQELIQQLGEDIEELEDRDAPENQGGGGWDPSGLLDGIGGFLAGLGEGVVVVVVALLALAVIALLS